MHSGALAGAQGTVYGGCSCSQAGDHQGNLITIILFLYFLVTIFLVIMIIVIAIVDIARSQHFS
jgi:hypothetical protein